MSWYAIEAIDAAIDDTKELLLPFDLGTWLRLALIVIFTGSGISFVDPISFIPPDLSDVEYSNNTSAEVSEKSTVSTTELGNQATGLATAHTGISNTVLGLIGLSLIGIVALFFYISSVFEFIYYQSLLDKNVSIRENFRKHWLKGVQFFVFEILYLLLVAALVIAIIAGFMINFGLGVLGVLLAIPIFIALAVFAGLVHDFVLLQMIESEENLLSAWRSIWPELKNQWREVVVYLVVKIGISIAIGIAIVTLFFGLLIAVVIVFGIFAVLLGLMADILVLIPLLAGMLVLGILMLAATVVTSTFVYFFIIEVYHSLTS